MKKIGKFIFISALVLYILVTTIKFAITEERKMQDEDWNYTFLVLGIIVLAIYVFARSYGG